MKWIPLSPAGTFVVVDPAWEGLSEFRAGVGDLPFTFPEHLVHQLPTADPVI